MRIVKIEWRNFTSYGNRTHELDISGDTKLFQVIGENGAGKTSISQVVMFCLYGKVEGKKLKDLPNRINGNAWTRITLDNYGSKIQIERGLNPNIFTLEIDGIPYDKAGNVQIQEYLTDDILGIPYHVFSNTILLSINDFKSFVKMTPQDKRSIVDKIFGFDIINQMREILKSEIRKIKENINRLDGRISSLDSSIRSSLQEMELLSIELEKKSGEKIIELNESLATFNKLSALHNGLIASQKKEEDDLYHQSVAANRSLIETRTSISELDKKLHLFDNDKCPLCEADLHSDFHSKLKDIMIGERATLESKVSELSESTAAFKTLEDNLRKNKTELNDKGIKIQTRIRSIMEEIKNNAVNTDSKVQTEALQRIVDNLGSDHTKSISEKIKTEERHNWIKTMDDVLGEKGVKQMAIKTILPALNSEILDLLRKMNLPYQVIFDEEFNASIFHMGIEIPSQTLSTGEMKKVDFIVLVSIIKLMKMKFNNINILFLDELFSSVDPNGVYSILEILKDISAEMGLNIFVISPITMQHEMFDVKLEIKKVNNFSTIDTDLM